MVVDYKAPLFPSSRKARKRFKNSRFLAEEDAEDGALLCAVDGPTAVLTAAD